MVAEITAAFNVYSLASVGDLRWICAAAKGYDRGSSYLGWIASDLLASGSDSFIRVGAFRRRHPVGVVLVSELRRQHWCAFPSLAAHQDRRSR
jgi:hypothetical protein